MRGLEAVAVAIDAALLVARDVGERAARGALAQDPGVPLIVDRDVGRALGQRAVAGALERALGVYRGDGGVAGVGPEHGRGLERMRAQHELAARAQLELVAGFEPRLALAPNAAAARVVAAAARAANLFVDCAIAVVVEVVAALEAGHDRPHACEPGAADAALLAGG